GASLPPAATACSAGSTALKAWKRRFSTRRPAAVVARTSFMAFASGASLQRTASTPVAGSCWQTPPTQLSTVHPSWSSHEPGAHVWPGSVVVVVVGSVTLLILPVPL